MNALRVAFFTDSFHEVNGVAHTSRMLETFARSHGHPFLSFHAGRSTRESTDRSVRTVELKRGAASFGLERDLQYDLLHWRHLRRVKQALRDFRADIVHITGPGDMGQLGAYAAHALGIPTVASWHTNLHEYAGRRLQKLLSFLPQATVERVSAAAEKWSLELTMWFYRVGRVVLAPNEELVALARQMTGRPAYLMRRGVDTSLFTPARRQRHDATFRLGYVGRLSPEKNVRFLAALEQGLIAAGRTDYEFVIVGDGSEKNWLRANMRRARFTGILRGEELARAYADMDLFVFPSRTDTFGNVVLEAMASGVPAAVTAAGGPKSIVQPGVTGFVARDDDDFIQSTIVLASHCRLFDAMRKAAREAACRASWDKVFEGVYQVYATCVEECGYRRDPGASQSSPAFDSLELMRD